MQRRAEPSLSASLSLHRTLDYCDDGQCRAVVDTGGGSSQETTSYFYMFLILIQRFNDSKLLYIFYHLLFFYRFPFPSNQMVGTVLLFKCEARHLIACSTRRLCRAASAGQDLVLWWFGLRGEGPCKSSKSFRHEVEVFSLQRHAHVHKPILYLVLDFRLKCSFGRVITSKLCHP